MSVTINLIVALAIIAGLIALQIYLSRRESRWPGLVLPIVTLLLSVTLALGNFAFRADAKTSTTNEDGSIQVVPVDTDETPVPELEYSSLAIIPIANIPTVVFLAIYASERHKFRMKNQRQKMDIQDL